MLLIDLAGANYGGWPTFTAHLAKGLGESTIYRMGQRTETQVRSYRRGLSYRNVGRSTLEVLAGSNPTIVTAATAKQADEVAELAAQGAVIVIHDPTEVKGAMKEALAGARIILIRRTNLDTIGAIAKDVVVVPHPYQRLRPRRAVKRRAVSISRIDFDKHTELIAAANERLSEPIAIYGAMNRLYAFHKLDAQYPGWQENWKGSPGKGDLWAGAQVARTATVMVDLSTIAGDGGGTQYTTLEAADAGAGIILNSKWLTGKPELDEVADVATFVNDVDELSKAVVNATEPTGPTAQAIEAMLDRHNAVRVAESVKEFVQ